MKIDCYGRILSKTSKGGPDIPVWKAITIGNTTYLRFYEAEREPIQRITQEEGVTTVEWAFGAWSNKETLEYVPINSPLEV